MNNDNSKHRATAFAWMQNVETFSVIEMRDQLNWSQPRAWKLVKLFHILGVIRLVFDGNRQAPNRYAVAVPELDHTSLTCAENETVKAGRAVARRARDGSVTRAKKQRRENRQPVDPKRFRPKSASGSMASWTRIDNTRPTPRRSEGGYQIMKCATQGCYEATPFRSEQSPTLRKWCKTDNGWLCPECARRAIKAIDKVDAM